MEIIKSDCCGAPIELGKDGIDLVGLCTQCSKIAVSSIVLLDDRFSSNVTAFPVEEEKVKDLSSLIASMLVYRPAVYVGPVIAEISYKLLHIEGFRCSEDDSSDLELGDSNNAPNLLKTFLAERLRDGEEFVIKTFKSDGEEIMTKWKIKSMGVTGD